MLTPDMTLWTGRDDTPFDGPKALRWHQSVKPLTADAEPGVVLLGFACDEGVRRNGGRVGAKDGPRAIRKALASMASHHDRLIYDGGDIVCIDGDLESAQSHLAEAVAEAIAAGHRPLVLGGGHETAWCTFQGIVKAEPSKSLGIINIDAHFDLRGDPVANSGTPFRQMADWCRERGREFRYLCLGIASPSNTPALFDRAMELGAEWVPDFECEEGPDEAASHVREFCEEVDSIYLSLDLDVLPASTMPAVSAHAARGVSLATVEELIAVVLDGERTIAIDIVELNPAFDIDNHGARVAARLADQIANRWEG